MLFFERLESQFIVIYQLRSLLPNFLPFFFKLPQYLRSKSRQWMSKKNCNNFFSQNVWVEVYFKTFFKYQRSVFKKYTFPCRAMDFKSGKTFLELWFYRKSRLQELGSVIVFRIFVLFVKFCFTKNGKNGRFVLKFKLCERARSEIVLRKKIPTFTFI